MANVQSAGNSLASVLVPIASGAGSGGGVGGPGRPARGLAGDGAAAGLEARPGQAGSPIPAEGGDEAAGSSAPGRGRAAAARRGQADATSVFGESSEKPDPAGRKAVARRRNASKGAEGAGANEAAALSGGSPFAELVRRLARDPVEAGPRSAGGSSGKSVSPAAAAALAAVDADQKAGLRRATSPVVGSSPAIAPKAKGDQAATAEPARPARTAAERAAAERAAAERAAAAPELARREMAGPQATASKPDPATAERAASTARAGAETAKAKGSAAMAGEAPPGQAAVPRVQPGPDQGRGSQSPGGVQAGEQAADVAAQAVRAQAAPSAVASALASAATAAHAQAAASRGEAGHSAPARLRAAEQASSRGDVAAERTAGSVAEGVLFNAAAGGRSSPGSGKGLPLSVAKAPQSPLPEAALKPSAAVHVGNTPELIEGSLPTATQAGPGGVETVPALGAGGPAGPRPILEQVIESIQDMVRTGQRVTVRLEPPELGRVRLTLQADGSQVRGVLEVQDVRVLEELRRETAVLTDRLAAGGVELRRLDVQLAEPPDHRGADGRTPDSLWQDLPESRPDGGGQDAGEHLADPGHRGGEQMPDVPATGVGQETPGVLVTEQSISVWI